MASMAPGTRASSTWRHPPNAISALRIAPVAPVARAIQTRCFRVAWGLAVVAGVSGGVAGRQAHRQSGARGQPGVIDES